MANEVQTVAPMGLELVDGSKPRFGTLGDIISFAKWLNVNGMAPRGTSPDQNAIAILEGVQHGISPFQAIQNIAVINGRPTMWGDEVGAIVKASGLCEDEYEEWTGEGDSTTCKYHVKRKGMKHETVGVFSVQEAKRAGLWAKEGPWKSYPRRMLKNRARAFAYRDAFPDVLKGISVREEMEDVIRAEKAKAEVSPSPIAEDKAEETKPRKAKDILKKVAEPTVITVEPEQVSVEHEVKQIEPMPIDKLFG